ncbi:MAG: ribonuclease P protein component [Gammaproteobacteria bacterium]|nr:MAG: ribonuclease P protein component [Gammaproteobacteria bacterium]
MSGSRTLRHPRTARLLLPGDFAALRGGSKRLAAQYFHCEFRPNDLDGARLGMAVSKRVSKRAVERNRVRRQIRESFRLCRAQLPACDVLVIARSAATGQINAILRRDLEQLWGKLAAVKPAVSAAAH